jgi:hypothetical protein
MKNIDLMDGVRTKPEPLDQPVGVCFTESDKRRWDELNERLKKKSVNHKKKIRMAEFGRKALLNVMDQVEKMLESAS